MAVTPIFNKDLTPVGNPNLVPDVPGSNVPGVPKPINAPFVNVVDQKNVTIDPVKTSAEDINQMKYLQGKLKEGQDTNNEGLIKWAQQGLSAYSQEQIDSLGVTSVPTYTITDAEKAQYNNLDETSLARIAAENSAAWHTATPEEKLRLQALNQYINGELLGKKFNSGTGQWTSPVVTDVVSTGDGTGTGDGDGDGDGDGNVQVLSDMLGDSKYDEMTQNLVQQLLDRLQTGFQYDPATDTALQNAQKNVARSTMEQMNARGILNSTITQDVVAEQFGNLTAQYEQIARGHYNDETARLMDFGKFISDLDSKSFDKAVTMWEMDMKERAFQYGMEQDKIANDRQAMIDEYEIKRNELIDAMDRIEERGYVDAKDSIITGLPVNMLSRDARERIQDQLWKIDDDKRAMTQFYDQLEAELQADIDLHNHKVDKQLEVLGEQDLLLNGTTEQRQAYIEWRNKFEGPRGPKGDKPPATAMETVNHLNKQSIKDYLIPKMGEKLYNDLFNYFYDKVVKPKEFTPEEEAKYEKYVSKYTSGVYANDPIKALEDIQKDTSIQLDMDNNDLYNDLLDRIGTLINFIPEEEKVKDPYRKRLTVDEIYDNSLTIENIQQRGTFMVEELLYSGLGQVVIDNQLALIGLKLLDDGITFEVIE